MKPFALVALCGLLSACTGSVPQPPQQGGPAQINLTGEYTSIHTITFLGEKDWEEGEVRDTLSIVEEGDSARFYFGLVQTNFHLCEMQGEGIRTPDGIVAPPEEIEFGGETATCNLRIVADSDTIRLVDEDNICRRYYCGARASIDGVEFPRR